MWKSNEEEVPDCPKCGSEKVLQILHLHSDAELELTIENDEVKIGEWKFYEKKQYSCLTCDYKF